MAMADQDVEQWRPMPDTDGVYAISDRGRVRREVTSGRGRAGRFLTVQ